MKSIKAIAAACFLLACGPAVAGELGRVEFDGRQIILFDDNRWEFAETSQSGTDRTVSRPANCTEKASKIVPLSICLDMDDWASGRLNAAQEYGFINPVLGLYLVVIAERLEMGLSLQRKAAVHVAKNSPLIEEVKETLYETVEIGGKTFGHIVYSLKIEDTRLTYSNYHTSFEGKGSAQVIVFTTSDLFESNEGAIAEIVAGIAVTR